MKMGGPLRAAAPPRPTRREVPPPGLPRARPGAQDAVGLVQAFIRWLDGFGEQSHDPYDFWTTRLGRRAKRLYYRRRLLGTLTALPFVALDTFVPSSRRVIATRQRSPMADAHFALGFFAWADATGDPAAVSRAEHFLAELRRSRSSGFGQLCWGLPFDWESRIGTIAAGTPLITVVPYVYEAFEAGF